MYRQGCVVLLLMTLCSSLPADMELSRKKRVVGGSLYGKEDFPSAVSLWYMGKNNPYTIKTPGLHHTCGGSLIADQWVLTAGVCFDDDYLEGLGNKSLWKVYLGMHAQTDAATEAQYREVGEVFMLPEYNISTTYGDIALIKLNKPAVLGPTVGLISLNGNADCPKEDQDVEVIGWGQTQGEIYGLGSDVPHKATVKVANDKSCHDKYEVAFAEYGVRIDAENNLCAGLPEGGVDACYGDAGSALLATCPGDDKQVVVATVSYGYGCATPNFPAVYTRVSTYYDWMMKTMADN